jgi:protein involved in polysaccharide export with SLBB domain
MTTKILAVLALALFISACEPTSTETNPAPSPTAQPAATPASTLSTEADHPAANVAFKAGDKVKVTINGSAVEAVIVSVDDKAGKAVVKVAGETKERNVTLSEIVKQ